MLVSPQIPLQLEPRRPDRFEDFLPGPNGRVLAAVRGLLEEESGILFLSGPPGSGKSHLLNALCLHGREQGKTAFYVALKRLPEEAAASLEGLGHIDLVCVDDLDQVAGNPEWESALFACFNQVRAGGGNLLISSGRPLASLPLTLPDLASRLAWGVSLKLELPGDDGKLEILQQRARTLRITLPEDVQNYLIKHGKRDMASLLQTLERMKDAAFAGKRKITVPLAREALKSRDRRNPC